MSKSNLQRMNRTEFIGGSDVAAILGVSPWKSPFQLYQEKVGAYVEEITPAKQRLFDRGARWEPIVLEMLVDELQERGHQVKIIATNQRYNDADLPFLACELDAEMLIDGEEVNAEMKTANHFAAAGWGAYDADDIPIYYAAQGMHGLMIKPRRRVVFAAVTGFDERPMIRWMERDEETIAAIRAKEIAFWDRVLRIDPPDPETAEDVKWLYRRDAGLEIEADLETQMLVQDLKDMKAHVKFSESRIELLTTQLKLRMGDAAILLGPDGKPIATWKSSKDSAKTNWKDAFEMLLGFAWLQKDQVASLIAEATKTTAGARPLLLK